MTNHPIVMLALLIPDTLLPSTSALQTLTTPYETIHYEERGGVCWFAPALPQALIYGAKALGCTYVVELLAVHGVNRLAQAGDLLVPHDVVDMTAGRCTTFFVGKGYGFLPQHQPYCPVLRATLHQAACQVAETVPLATRPRVFARGIYGATTSDQPLDEPACHTLLERGVDVVGVDGVPTSFLARELELCYAPLAALFAPSPRTVAIRKISSHYPPLSLLLPLIVAAVQQLLPPSRSCLCADAMRPTRERGLVDDEWQSWIGHDPGFPIR